MQFPPRSSLGSLVPTLLLVAPLASCSTLLSYSRFVPATSESQEWEVSRTGESFLHDGVAGVYFGRNAILCLRAEETELRVSAESHGYSSMLAGPLLPVLPFFVFTSPVRRRLVVHVEVHEAAQPYLLMPADMRLFYKERRLSALPLRASKGDLEDDEAGEVFLLTQLTIAAGESAHLLYEIDSSYIDSLELELPGPAPHLGGGTATFESGSGVAVIWSWPY